LSKAGYNVNEVEKEFDRSTLNTLNTNDAVYYLHGDHLGTATFVTNEVGEATQFFLNLPFGETMVEQQDPTSYANPYKFNAKELGSETGLYYYGARYYNPRISIWYGVDPLAEKMPSWSPYAYCYNNPIKFIDPDGRESKDIYELTRNGTLIWKEKSDRDVIYASKNFDGNGKLKAKNDGGVDVGKSGDLVKNSDSRQVSYLRDNKVVTKTYNYLKFGGDKEKSQETFDYFSENTNVEFNRMSFTNNKNDGFNFVGTINEELEVPLVTLGSNLVEYEHNHPDPFSFNPSGFNVNYSPDTGKFDYSKGLPTGDIMRAKEYPKTKFLLYAPNYRTGPLRIQYNGESIISINNEGKRAQ